MNWLNRLFKNQKGVFLVFTAVLLPIIFACAGLAMDLGNAFAHKSKLQNAADAAVLVYGKIDYGNNKEPETAEKYMKANGVANKMYKITERPLTGTGDANSVLLSLYASEDVPTTFMRMFGFDKVPVSVVATCKVTKIQPAHGVFDYAFIVGDNRKASQITSSPWDSNWDGPFQFYNNQHKIIGKFHANGAIQIVNNIDGDHKINGTRNVFIDKSSNFSTSIKDDMELWFNKSTLNKWEYADLKSKTTLHDHDVPKDPTNLTETEWYHMARFGYETDGVNGRTWGEDIVASEHYEPEIDISLGKDNSQTEAIYNYIENLKNTHTIDKDDVHQQKSNIYIKTDGQYDKNGTYPAFDGWGKYSVIISDGDVELNQNLIDMDAMNKKNTPVVVVSLHGNVTIRADDNATLKALIYAPNGLIDYQASHTFIGSMVAKRIRLEKPGTTYTWNSFNFPNIGTSDSGGSSGNGSSGNTGSDSTGSIGKVTLHADQDSNYGNESTLWGN